MRISCKLHDFLVQLPQISMHLDLVLESELHSLHTIRRACSNIVGDLEPGGVLLATIREQRAKAGRPGSGVLWKNVEVSGLDAAFLCLVATCASSTRLLSND